MNDPLTTPVLSLLTLLAGVASAMALSRLTRSKVAAGVRRIEYVLLGTCTTGCGALFCYRTLMVHCGWQPLRSHVDGLLLIATLFAAMVLFLQSRGRVRGLTAFALPVLTLILAWSVCASAWTFQFFQIDSIWKAAHLASVYLGTLFFAVAAISGGMFLYAQRRVRKRPDTGVGRRLASLEAIEHLIIWTSTMGLSLLTLGLVMGVIIVSSGPTRMGSDWWYSPKIILGGSVWLIYALVMNMRHTATFRGAKAAWLSIVGLVLILAIFGLAVSGQPFDQSDDESQQPHQVMEVD